LPSLYYIFFGIDSLGEDKTEATRSWESLQLLSLCFIFFGTDFLEKRKLWSLKQPEPDIFNFEGAQESIPRNQFRQAV
jgi:hypothetical protein